MTKEQQDALLVELQTDVRWIKEGFKSHLSQHWQIKIIAIGSVLAAITAWAF